ncbi:MAG TPA: CoA transferase [Burkholderiales bacterium]|jgi:crotonobetainyl-CoA:carnitine CoA-transferase CaiB-like acyl-CoA transferase
MQSLSGIKVIDISHVIAGPLASHYLTQLGASVLKIENPRGGDVMRGRKPGQGDTHPGFGAFNHGKHSLAIDLKDARGRDLMLKLAAGADVFIENFRPGVIERLGLGYEAVKAVNPDIIYCSLSGYGQSGEWSGRGAYDHVIQALTGMMMMAGEEGDAPIKVGFPVVDVATGMVGAMSILSALYRREKGGGGQRIDASMAQAALQLMYPQASTYLSTGEAPARIGNRGFSGSPGADTYQCADGWLSIAANIPEHFRLLCGVLDLEHLCGDARYLDLERFNAEGGGFVVARDLEGLRAQLRTAFATRSAPAMEAALNAAGVPAARVRRIGEFLDEVRDGSRLSFPQVETADPEGRVRSPGVGYDSYPDRPGTAAAAPRLGEHTRVVLRWAGVSDADIQALKADGVVTFPEQET